MSIRLYIEEVCLYTIFMKIWFSNRLEQVHDNWLKKRMIIGFYYRPENTKVKWYSMNSTSKFRVV